MVELRTEPEYSGEILAPSDPHLAFLLLIDTSASMNMDGKIDFLTEAINNFLHKMSTDEVASRRVDIAIIEFNNTVKVVQDFSPISQVEPVTLEAKGCTAMGESINFAIDKIKERNYFYNSMGTPCFKPWIFMITDGEPTDDISVAAERIKLEESKGEQGKLNFWSVGVPGYNSNILVGLSNKHRILEMSNYDFNTLFDWIMDTLFGCFHPMVSIEPLANILPVKPIKKTEVPDDWNVDSNW